jgi:lysophospholipase L1-like esterase
MNADRRMGSKPPDFQFLACSGDTAEDVLANQVPAMKQELQMVTVSAGGNDVGLVDLLNYCIYQFGDTSLGAFDVKCNQLLDQSAEKIKKELPAKLARLYTAVQKKLAPGGTVYV